MSVKSFSIQLIARNDIKDFIEKWHYSHSINGVISDYCFALFDGNKLIGAMILGRLAMASQWKKYGEREKDVIELRRLCCIDETPKNTESFFIGYVLRWLKKNTDIKVVVSYADPDYGHAGVIYRASNFLYKGLTSPGKVIFWNGKKYHDKCIRTQYKGELKPFAKLVKDALDRGDAVYKKTPGKHIFVYMLSPTTPQQ